MGFIVLQCSRCGSTHAMEYSARNVLNAVRSGWNSCGGALMLCDECSHRTGEYVYDCDYNDDTGARRFNPHKVWIE